MKITHLFDNNSLNPELHALWGYSVLVEKEGKRILMDTGSNGRLLLKNMKRLEVDPASLDYVFISHRHWDHIGGLDSILELNPNVQLVVPHSLSNHLLKDLRDNKYPLTVVDEDPVEISDGVFSTGTLGGSEPEQALVIIDETGLMVITGCAHPGLEQIVKTCQDYFKEPVKTVMGGFHLLSKSKAEIEAIARMLNETGVQSIAPSHCTGDKALQLLQKYFNGQYIKAGAGKSYSF